MKTLPVMKKMWTTACGFAVSNGPRNRKRAAAVLELGRVGWVLAAMLVLMMLAPVARADFYGEVDLSPLNSVAVQHQQTLKTFDSFSRQILFSITGKGRFEEHDATFAVLDMAFRPEAYNKRNLIKIKNVPVRNDFRLLESIDDAERDRIVREGTISLEFWTRPDVQQLMQSQMATAVFKAEAIGQIDRAATSLSNLIGQEATFPPVAMIAPAKDSKDKLWHSLGEIAGNVPDWAESIRAAGKPVPPPLPGYDTAQMDRISRECYALMEAWRKQDAAGVNLAVKNLADVLPAVNPVVYPSEARREVEIVYNKLAKLTIPGAAFYFAAFVCFLMSVRSGFVKLRLWGLRLFIIAYLIHTTGIAVRWWLVAGQHGNWFDGIPIKNQFESVLMSAWFGATLGLILELWRSRGIFGAAASFVGWLSLIAIFTVPYVLGKDIGGEIGQVNGVLMSYWLYIHVTMVVASYALIGMGFALSVWWLVRYYMEFGTLRKLPSRQLSSDVSKDFDLMPAGGGGAALSMGRTILQVLFFPVRSPEPAVVAKSNAKADVAADVKASAGLLASLDLCNLVVLQLAFWILGAGIVFGAVWADMSWGRPWGWDPKETFALVTWIVYLVVVHVRVATDDKAWWTAVLSIIGFFIMLFNWIGVNFFMVGLHSYA